MIVATTAAAARLSHSPWKRHVVMPLVLLLGCNTVAVVSMSLLVLRGASAASSATSRATTSCCPTAIRAATRDDHDHCSCGLEDAPGPLERRSAADRQGSPPTSVEANGAAVQGTPPAPNALLQSGGLGCGPTPKPPLFSLRHWFAPRQKASSTAAFSRGWQALGMVASSGSAATSEASSTTTVLPTGPSPSEVSGVCCVASASATATSGTVEVETETASAPTVATDSVHLQLTGISSTTPKEEQQQQAQNKTLIRVHSFVHEGKTYLALNTPKHKFRSFLEYLNVTASNAASDDIDDTGSGAAIRTLRVAYDAAARSQWRELWKQRRLVTDRTELLAVYPSDAAASSTSSLSSLGRADGASSADESVPKRGGFADLLHLYAERFAAILADEAEARLSERDDLVTWLEAHYGATETRQMQADRFHALSLERQLSALRHFLEWFRSRFPYYYDRCGHCGASMKEDLANRQPPPAAALEAMEHHDNSPPSSPLESTSSTSTTANNSTSPATACSGESKDMVAKAKSSILEVEESSTTATADGLAFSSDDGDAEATEEDEDDEEEEEEIESSEYQTFIGYIYPSDDELQGKASRTELYRCHACEGYTRFPRFNAARNVLECSRGRCGEYSMLLYRFLRALDHQCRWVVDWSDHVWAEVRLTGKYDSQTGREIPPRWVHLDPCEAAVDQNLLYQDWGKKQTYILGFAAPHDGSATEEHYAMEPLIEDVTLSYTSDSWEAICQRRDDSEDNVRASIAKASQELKRKLATHLATKSMLSNTEA